MIIPIVLCPSWNIESPPYNLALLKAVLNQNGYKAICYDFNMELYNYIKDEIEKESWLTAREGNCWKYKEFAIEILRKYADFIDNYINKILSLNCKIISFSVNQRNYFFTLEIINKIKKIDKHKFLILGGPSCFREDKGSAILEESLADAICIGEGEKSFVNILKIIEENGELEKCAGIIFKDKKGDIIDGGDELLLENLDILPFADFSDFNFSAYKRKWIPTLMGRGCINRCIFCSEWERFKKYRHRSAKNIYDEIIYQKEKFPFIEVFPFNDSLINADIKILDELCTLFIEHDVNIEWSGQAMIRKEMSKGFLEKLKKAGCSVVIYGVESGSNNILRLMRKPFTAELAHKVIKETRGAGIGVNFNIIVGFPGEDDEDFMDTLQFVKNNLEYADEVNLSPLCLSRELFSDREKWGILFPEHGDVGIEWITNDKKNNYEIRLKKIKTLEEMIGNKSTSDFGNDFEYYLRKAEECLRNGNKKEAAKFYFKAKRVNKDKNTNQIIEEKISTIANKRIKFAWDIHYKCNFRCPYCRFYKEWAILERRNLYLASSEWMEAWRRIYDKYGEVKIEIAGGEPFVYPNFIELIKNLSSIHLVKITTNLSGDIEHFAKEINPERVNLDLKYHLLFIDLETVIKKTIILKNAGFKDEICYLAYPPQMHKIKYLSDCFQKEGIDFALAVFVGEYNGKKYPAAYSQEEREMMRPFLREMDRITYHLNTQSPRGKLCNAGHTYVNIQADGNVVRCLPLGGKSMGNILDENFQLFRSSLPCEADFCHCNEYNDTADGENPFK